MLASVDHGFVVLMNQKSGSQALEDALIPFADIYTGHSGSNWRHLDYRGVKKIFGDFFDENRFDWYTVVRHPIDVVASWYKFRSRKELAKSNRYTGHLTFREFLDDWASHRRSPAATFRAPHQIVLDQDGNPGPIKCCPYERIDELIDLFAQRLGQPLELTRKNDSPNRALDFDRDEVARIPRMKKWIQAYNALPFEI